MVRLKNIVKNEKTIECEIYPEDSETAGKLSINTETGDYTYSLPKGYEWCTNHVSHAKNAIMQILDTGSKLPEEKLIIWG